MKYRKHRRDDDRLEVLPRVAMRDRNEDLTLRSQAVGAEAIGTKAVGSNVIGALAVGAFAIGALAIGALVIGRLTIGRARIRRLDIDELVVRKLRITEEMRGPEDSIGDGTPNDSVVRTSQ